MWFTSVVSLFITGLVIGRGSGVVVPVVDYYGWCGADWHQETW